MDGHVALLEPLIAFHTFVDSVKIIFTVDPEELVSRQAAQEKCMDAHLVQQGGVSCHEASSSSPRQRKGPDHFLGIFPHPFAKLGVVVGEVKGLVQEIGAHR